MNQKCKYWDCGWCYAPDNVGTNADAQSACVKPSSCPYLGMTEHPLTDEICEEIAEDVFYYNYSISTFRCDMRSAADWQLGEVIEFLSNNLDERYVDDGDALAPGIDVESVIDDLKQAMRPTKTQEDN